MKPTTTAVKNPTPLNLLKRARNLIRSLGMAKRALSGTNPKTNQQCYCVRGAIMTAACGRPDWHGWTSAAIQADRYVAIASQELFPERCNNYLQLWSAVDFNNHPETTKKDLLRVMKRAQEIAAANQQV